MYKPGRYILSICICLDGTGGYFAYLMNGDGDTILHIIFMTDPISHYFFFNEENI